MTSEPAVSFEVALFFAALAIAIVIWVFARVALDYRMMRRRREALQDKLTAEQFEAWDRLHGILAVLRDRARGWATDDFVAAQRALEAIEQFESESLSNPESLGEAATRTHEILRTFDEDPSASQLQLIYKRLE